MNSVARSAAQVTTEGGAAIARLNPFDGLFLRAEHLQRMQDYTSQRTEVLGQAGGPGVVYGYGVTIEVAGGSTRLVVSPGLAFNAAGVPLLMTTPHQRPLDDLPGGTDSVWVINLYPKPDPFGDEEVYGALCADPCGGNGGTTRPYVAERVGVEIDEVNLTGVAGSPALQRRSAVAKAWFEKERADAGAPVSASERDGNRPADFAPKSWMEPTGLAADTAVAVGVLLRVAGNWDVDAWIARRDRLETPPRRGWQQRLGMRPLDVFIAQVLQFQVQLAEAWPRALAGAAGLARALRAVDDLEWVRDELVKGRRKEATERVTEVISVFRGRATTGSLSYRLVDDGGFVELPPAGYLPLAGGELKVEDQIATLFGGRLELRYCLCRADAVADAVQRAQHLDRIPLVTGARPQVDILVPDGVRDEAGEITTPRNWVAFHRRRDIDCHVEVAPEPEPEPVEIFLHRAGTADEYQDVVRRVRAGQPPGPSENASVIFPPDLSGPPPQIPPAVVSWTAGVTAATVIALVRTPDRYVLAETHAAMLAAWLDTPGIIETITTRVVGLSQPETETIHVVVQRTQAARRKP